MTYRIMQLCGHLGTPPPTKQTDTTENITFPRTMYAGGKGTVHVTFNAIVQYGGLVSSTLIFSKKKAKCYDL